ncbi:MAG: alpha/beta hydrolase [Steroidobacteraceae bacterium]
MRVLLTVAALLFSFSAPAQNIVTDATIDLPTSKVFYRDSGGKGIPVVFLHAGSGNSMMWEHQIPVFIKAGYRFIAIDYRGVDNAAAGSGGGKSMQLIDELVSKLGLQKFHLLGTAGGGGTAMQYAMANPDKLRSLIVTNSTGNVQDTNASTAVSRTRPAMFSQLPLEFRELGPSYRYANPEGVQRWLALSSEREGNGPGDPSTTPRTNPVQNRNTVTWEKLTAFKVPTLMMTGDADLYTPPSALRQFATRMKQAEWAITPDSGHSSYWENPEAFNSRVLKFIKKH